jgi:tetratricopeptide (TPR) repeat protein
MAWAGGDAATALGELSQALDLFESAGETHPAARVSARLGEVEWRNGELDRALARMEEALDVLSTDVPDADVAALAAQLGRLYYFRGEVELAEKRAMTALAVAERLWLPGILSDALSTLGVIATTRNHFETGTALQTHAFKVALEHDDSSAALRAGYNLADLLSNRDAYEGTPTLRGGLALARKVGTRRHEVLPSSTRRIPFFCWAAGTRLSRVSPRCPSPSSKAREP